MEPLYLLAAQSSSGGLIGALGINWRSLLLNTLAFFVILAILRKFVYPVLIKALDAKQEELQAAAKAETDAKERLAAAEESAEVLLADARMSADQVLANATAEAHGLIDEATSKAQAQSKRIAAEAHDQLDIDVESARRALKAETARLVASATEVVLAAKLDTPRDADLIKRSLETNRS
jgi:F-type H+-transporting ATPase subunit b